MHPELEKLDAFFAEAQRLWETNPELVVSRRFYELWEETHGPRPFQIADGAFTVAGQEFPLEDADEAVLHAAWDAEEACPALVIDTELHRRRLLFGFNDGRATVTEGAVLLREDDALSFGERLEIIYDVIHWHRETYPARDVRDIAKADFLRAVDLLKANYEPHAVKVMRKLRVKDVRKLIARAAQDMASDELSDQLMLPLDGTYAHAAERHLVSGPSVSLEIPLGTRTHWQVLSQLRFVERSLEARADAEAQFVLTFDEVEVVHREPGGVVIRMALAAETPLEEGAQLFVSARGESHPIGRLHVILIEDLRATARLSWSDPGDGTDWLSKEIFARPRRSPFLYLHGVFAALVQSFSRDRTFASPVHGATLGAGEFTLVQLPQRADPDGALDPSQFQAFENAVCTDNPVVAVQGPPGTGKTHVLERVLRALVAAGKRVLLTAPSNAAVDNVCRRIAADLPVLRLGRDQGAIAADVREECWIGLRGAIVRFRERRDRGVGSVYAGTHVGLLRDDLVQADLRKNGIFDAIVFDEAGMASLSEFLICSELARRAILFGDHRQLPPFPLAHQVNEVLREDGPVPPEHWQAVQDSALEWLAEVRGVPVIMLNASYRCQNPRLMRFSSTLFYDARVRTSQHADYYQLAYQERQTRYPAATLRLYSTSRLPVACRHEQLILEGNRPGLENRLEARLAVELLYRALAEFPLEEISVISPYRRQVRLIRDGLERQTIDGIVGREISDREWETLRYARIATVDSFQGGESDVVIISYVRSNDRGNTGFVDDPNRVNVTHTRSRREMHVIGDFAFLKAAAGTRIFTRMERAIFRDGEIIHLTASDAERLLAAGRE